MPGLPEVETVVRDLRPLLVGRGLTSVRVGKRTLRRPWHEEWTRLLVGKIVREVRRRGKWIVLVLDNELSLLVHLGMTGQFTVNAVDEPEPDHTHLVFALDRGDRQLRFRDIRRFGSVSLFRGAEELQEFFNAMRLGPEPFDLKPGKWRQCLEKTERSLKAVLLDQRVVAGIGNIYADESLFEAGLAPTRRGCDLSRAEAERLRKAVAAVLKRAIELRGSTIRDYVGGSGLRGGFQREFRAYGRTGEPCSRCKTAIVCRRLAGRSTHYCPNCQQ